MDNNTRASAGFEHNTTPSSSALSHTLNLLSNPVAATLKSPGAKFGVQAQFIAMVSGDQQPRKVRTDSFFHA